MTKTSVWCWWWGGGGGDRRKWSRAVTSRRLRRNTSPLPLSLSSSPLRPPPPPPPLCSSFLLELSERSSCDDSQSIRAASLLAPRSPLHHLLVFLFLSALELHLCWNLFFYEEFYSYSVTEVRRFILLFWNADIKSAFVPFSKWCSLMVVSFLVFFCSRAWTIRRRTDSAADTCPFYSLLTCSFTFLFAPPSSEVYSSRPPENNPSLIDVSWLSLLS